MGFVPRPKQLDVTISGLEIKGSTGDLLEFSYPEQVEVGKLGGEVRIKVSVGCDVWRELADRCEALRQLGTPWYCDGTVTDTTSGEKLTLQGGIMIGGRPLEGIFKWTFQKVVPAIGGS